MPTYQVISSVNCLTGEQKKRIAAAITSAHHQITGAPTFLAQVIFVDIEPGNYFLGGVPLKTDQVFVHGHIRAGRSRADKDRLLQDVVRMTASAAELEADHVWAYLTELPPAQMAEFGAVLPDPGGEATWLATFPSEVRARLENIGK